MARKISLKKSFVLALTAMVGLVLLLTQSALVPVPGAKTAAVSPASVAATLPENPPPVDTTVKPTATRYYMGVYLADISGFDLKEGRFSADLQVWMKWAGDSASPPLRFTNGEVENMEEIAFESRNGWNSCLYRVQGTFRGTFPVHNFPFDNQQIRISLELPETQGTVAPDLAGSGMNNIFSITGWEYDPLFKAETAPSQYYSDFGSVYNEGKPYQVNQISFVLELRRPHIAYIFKFMLPLFIIILMAMVALLVPADQIEVRAGIGITALLTSISFQNAMADLIPEVSYLVIADKLFLISYVVIVITFIQTVLAFLKARTETAEDIKVARRWDRRVLLVLFTASMTAGIVVLNIRVKYDKPLPKPVVAAADSTVSHKDRLHIAFGAMGSLNSNNIRSSLLTRGLLYDNHGTMVPFLAEAKPELTNEYVKFLPDGGMTVIWRLKEGVKWSDGSPITSKDLAFSAEVEKASYGMLQDISIVDERTVELRFGNRRPDNLLQFEVYPSVIYDSLFTTYGADTLSEIRRWEVPLCTGPYRVVKFDTANGNLLVEANPHFAGKKPYIKEIFLYQSPTSTLDLALKDSLDMVFFLSPESYTKLQGTDKYAFRQFQSDQMLTLYPDLSVPIFQDINVRRAIACAIDRDAIRNIFSSSGSYSCGNMRPSFHPEYLADSSFQWSYNPGLARKYLSEAKTKERKIKLIGFFRDTTKTESKALLRMADMLQDVGFVVEVVKETKSSNISKMRYATNHGGLLVSNNTYPKSVSSFLNVPYLQEDYRLDSALWPIPPLMKELAYTFNSSMYQERKVVTSQELQKLHHQVIPSVPICVGTIVDARLNTIEGPDPYMGCLNFWNVEYWYFTDPAAKPKAPAQLPEQP